MKRIILTKNKIAIVDDADYELLNQYKWHLSAGYAVRRLRIGNSQIPIYMHRMITGIPDKYFTDHIDGNKLNNQKVNLRIATNSQNQANRKLIRSKTGHKGITFEAGKFRARITVNRKIFNLGRHEKIEDAINAYNKASKKYFKEYARSI